jgi:uncharacterized protein
VAEWTLRFPVSGVEANPLVLFFVALLVSAICAPAGVSGAFLLLPFQVSVLGFTSPGVSPTNLIYNVFATPGGIYRYAREDRIVWPLASMIVIGSLPGVFVGALLRTTYLSDPRVFRVFIGFVLLYLGLRLLYGTAAAARRRRASGPGELEQVAGASEGRVTRIGAATLSGWRIRYRYGDGSFSVGCWSVLLMAFAVGVVGGIYSIGGGALIAPFLVSVFALPVHTVAGAALIGTFVTSIAGVAFFELIPLASPSIPPASPDWLLGTVLGLGGLAGSYVGAVGQRFLSDQFVRAALGFLVSLISLNYLLASCGA